LHGNFVFAFSRNSSGLQFSGSPDFIGRSLGQPIAFEMCRNWWGNNLGTPHVLRLEVTFQIALLRMFFIA
jgi:hypothetical protein